MNDPRLERYLGALENSLRAFPVGDRAEIITEIRSHVLSALERDPTTRLDTVLASLGEPEMVANRYLLERGLKPTKPPISPIVKWLVIGFLTTFAMMLIFAGFLVTHFSKYVDFDTSEVKAFKFIDVDGKNNRVTIRGISPGDEFGGSINATNKVALIFDSGSMEISSLDEGKEMTWSCRGHGSSPNPKTIGDQTTLDFSNVRDLHCDVGIPAKSHLDVKGKSGKIEIEQPRFHVKANLESGKMEFSDASGSTYKFVTSVGSGKMDEFKSSDQKDALMAELHVQSGALSHDEE